MPHLLPVSLLATALLSFEPASVSSNTIELDRTRVQAGQSSIDLLDRIEDAAARVCRTEQRHSAHLTRALRTCIQATVEQTVAEIDHPPLSAAHARRLRGAEESRTNGTSR